MMAKKGPLRKSKIVMQNATEVGAMPTADLLRLEGRLPEEPSQVIVNDLSY